MSIYAQFDVDPKKEIEGVWFDDFHLNKDKTKPGFLIARMGGSNKKFGEVHERVTAPYGEDRSKLNDDEQKRINIEVFVDSVLLGWRNIYDRKGVEIPYSRDAALKLFSDLPELLFVLTTRSLDLERFVRDEIEESAKN